jgi:hypothetical protein
VDLHRWAVEAGERGLHHTEPQGFDRQRVLVQLVPQVHFEHESRRVCGSEKKLLAEDEDLTGVYVCVRDCDSKPLYALVYRKSNKSTHTGWKVLGGATALGLGTGLIYNKLRGNEPETQISLSLAPNVRFDVSTDAALRLSIPDSATDAELKLSIPGIEAAVQQILDLLDHEISHDVNKQLTELDAQVADFKAKLERIRRHANYDIEAYDAHVKKWDISMQIIKMMRTYGMNRRNLVAIAQTPLRDIPIEKSTVIKYLIQARDIDAATRKLILQKLDNAARYRSVVGMINTKQPLDNILASVDIAIIREISRDIDIGIILATEDVVKAIKHEEATQSNAFRNTSPDEFKAQLTEILSNTATPIQGNIKRLDDVYRGLLVRQEIDSEIEAKFKLVKALRELGTAQEYMLDLLDKEQGFRLSRSEMWKTENHVQNLQTVVELLGGPNIDKRLATIQNAQFMSQVNAHW